MLALAGAEQGAQGGAQSAAEPPAGVGIPHPHGATAGVALVLVTASNACESNTHSMGTQEHFVVSSIPLGHCWLLVRALMAGHVRGRLQAAGVLTAGNPRCALFSHAMPCHLSV